MADNDTTVVAELGFVPEPIPDNIADTELTGLQPADEPTGDEAEAPVQEATSDDQSTGEEPETEEPGEPEETPAETTEEEAAPTAKQEEQPELYGKERRLAEKAARTTYVNDQRQNIRQYEADIAQKTRDGELDDLQQIRETQKVIQANQYIDAVERTQMSVMNDGQRALSEIPFFSADTQQARMAFTKSIQDFRNAYGDYDQETGELIGTSDRQGNPVSLFNYLQEQAAGYEQLTADLKRQTQADQAKMRGKVVTPSNPGKVTSTGDDLEDLLNKIGDVDLTRL